MSGDSVHLLGRSDMAEPAAAAVLEHLDSVRSSDAFSGSPRRRDLLSYLVLAELEGRSGELSAYGIATDVLGRADSFDAQTDPIVRVEIGRVRAALDRYYRHNAGSPVVLDIPKGQYAAVITGSGNADGSGSVAILVLPVDRFSNEPTVAQVLDDLSEKIARRLDKLTDPLVQVDIADDESGSRALDKMQFVLELKVRSVTGEIRVTVTLRRPGCLTESWRDDLELRTSGLHPFEIEDLLIGHISGRIGDQFGALTMLLTEPSAACSTAAGRYPGHLQSRLNARYAAYTRPSRSAFQRLRGELPQPEPDSPAAQLAAVSDARFTSWWLGLDDDPDLLEGAFELATRAVGSDPSSVEAHLSLAYACFGMRDLAAFRLSIENALALPTLSPAAEVSAGLMLALSGEIDRGLDLCGSAVAHNPNIPAWWRVVPALAALQNADHLTAWMESVQVGDAGGFVGPLLRAATAVAAGREAESELRSLEGCMLPTGVHCAELVDRVFLCEQTRSIIVEGLVRCGVPVG